MAAKIIPFIKPYEPLMGQFHKAYDVGNGVLLFEIKRPPVNAYHEPMWREYGALFDAISKTSWIRAVVLASADDKIFTSGLDVKAAVNTLSPAAESQDVARKGFHNYRHVRDFQDAISAPERIHQPVIAAINGMCLGLGIDIAATCDVRLVSSDAKLGISEVNAGLAADIGSLQRLPKIIGNGSLARELALTGRFFGPQEAVDMGFVSRVVEGNRKNVIIEAVRVAKVMTSKSPVAVTGTKKMLLRDVAFASRSLVDFPRVDADRFIMFRTARVNEGLEMIAAWNSSMLQSEDTQMSMRAVLDRSTPTFRDLLAADEGHHGGKQSAKAKL